MNRIEEEFGEPLSAPATAALVVEPEVPDKVLVAHSTYTITESAVPLYHNREISNNLNAEEKAMGEVVRTDNSPSSAADKSVPLLAGSKSMGNLPSADFDEILTLVRKPDSPGLHKEGGDLDKDDLSANDRKRKLEFARSILKEIMEVDEGSKAEDYGENYRGSTHVESREHSSKSMESSRGDNMASVYELWEKQEQAFLRMKDTVLGQTKGARDIFMAVKDNKAIG